MEGHVGGQMRAKKLGSATLPHTWPKPIFHFKGSMGHLPVEAQPYVYVSRKNPLTGNYKIVPDMLYPIQANRQPAPRHEILEDEYRAYHGAMINHVLLKQKFLPDKTSRMSITDTRSVIDVDSILWSGRLNEVKDQFPQLLAYNPGVAPPPGYIYHRFKQGLKGNGRRRSNGVTTVRLLRRPPIVSFRDPFQNVVELCTPNYCDQVKYFDSAVVGKPRREETRIFNEPDAISSFAADAGFGQPLSERAKRVDAVSKKAGTKA